MNHFDPQKNVFWSGEFSWFSAIPQFNFLFMPGFFIQSQRKKFYTSNQNFKKPPIGPPRCQKKLTRVLAIQPDLLPRIMRFHTPGCPRLKEEESLPGT